MGTEDWVFKGTKFDNKYQKPKIKNLEQRLDSQKYNMKATKQKRKQQQQQKRDKTKSQKL